jgi:hypothetical protein
MTALHRAIVRPTFSRSGRVGRERQTGPATVSEIQSMHGSHTLALLLALIWPLGMAQAAQEPPKADSPGPRGGTLSIDLFLPRAISPEEIDRWSHRLELSEAQDKVLDTLYQQYLEKYAGSLSDLSGSLWTESAEVANCNNTSTRVICAEALRDLMKNRDRVVKEIAQFEARTFEPLLPLLTEQQSTRVAAVQLYRERCRLFVTHFDRPAARIDLRSLIDGLDDIIDVSPTDKEAFDALLTAYEASSTVQLRQYQRALISAMVEGRLAAAAMHREIDSTTGRERVLQSPRNLLLQERRDAGWRKVNDIELRLVELNRVYSRSLADLLGSETGEELVRRFRAMAFPSVYPDPFDASEVFESTLASDAVDGTTKEAVGVMLLQYQQRADQVARKMLASLDSWLNLRLETRQAHHTEYGEHKEEMDTLSKERSNVAMEAINSLEGILGSRTNEIIGEALKRREDRVATHKPHEMGIHYRP